MKFTQGQWKINKEKYATVIATKDCEICRVNHELTPTKEKAANARLIVKSPKLYALLVEIIGEQDFWPTDKDNSIYECRWCGRIYDNVNGPHALCSSDDCLGNRARQALKEVEGE